MVLFCEDCEKEFRSSVNYSRHREGTRCRGKGEKLSCPRCKKKFARPQNLLEHIRRYHPEGSEQLTFACGICDLCFANREEVRTHRAAEHVSSEVFVLRNSAHGKERRSYRLFFPAETVNSLEDGLAYSYIAMHRLMDSLLAEFASYKISFCLHVELHRLDEWGEICQEEVFPFQSLSARISRSPQGDGVAQEAARMVGDMERNLEEFVFQGSGWIVSRPVFLDSEVSRCDVLAGSGTRCRLHVTRKRRNQSGVLTSDPAPVQTEDGDEGEEEGFCFYYAVAAFFVGPDAGLEKVKAFCETMTLLPSRDRSQGVRVDDIGRFEELNATKLDVAINVVYWDEDGQVLPVRASKRTGARNEIVLQLFTTRSQCGDGKHAHRHFSLVPCPEVVLCKRPASETKASRRQRVKVCWNCFNVQTTQQAHENHIAFCHQNSSQIIKMPGPNAVRQYQEEGKSDPASFKSAFLLFYDFEALQVDPVKSCGCSDEVLENTRKAREEGGRAEARRRGEAAAARREVEQWALEFCMLEGEATARYELAREKAAGARRPPPRVPAGPPRLPAPKPPPRVKVCGHKTHVLKEQPPVAYSLLLVDRDGKVWEDITYVGEDCAEHFVFTVLTLGKKYLSCLSPGVPMLPMTARERAVLMRESTSCYLCEEPLGGRQKKVLDHDHLTGEFLGVAHDLCNLRRREKAVFTLFAHNFTGYDSHFLVRVFSKFPELIRDIWAIPVNSQRFKKIVVNRDMHFVDSCQFLTDSLANLVASLVKSGGAFPLLDRLAESPEEKGLLLRKGVYPYSFATSQRALEEQTELPPRSAFYSELSREECSLEDYEHARKVWDAFGCENMMDYTVLYMKTDVYLLAEVVLSFRNMVWSTFRLDLAQYVSLPHLSMDIMLKKTGVKMELIRDQEMSELLRKNIRGGHSFVNLRHAERREEVRRPETRDEYRDRMCRLFAAEPPAEAATPAERARREALVDSQMEEWEETLRWAKQEGEAPEVTEQESQTLLYLDANNLYGGSMSYPLPLNGFRWLSDDEVRDFDPQRDIKLEDGPGYILEVDLEYPPDLHLAHNSLPLAPEHLNVGWEDLSPYSRRCAATLLGKTSHKARKLSATFRPREKYLLHGFNLLLYLRLGLRLKKVRRVIAFNQERFIKPFIDECTRNRKEAVSASEQTMWKLVANSVYGKLIEGFEKRMRCVFERSAESARRSTTSPLFKSSVICDEDMSISFLKKKEVELSQCWAVGFSVLEISKLIMQRLYHEEILPRFGAGNVAIVMSDTDSFLLALRGVTEDEAMERLSDVMDLSNLPPEHPLFDSSRSRQPGLLKNELPRSKILEVVAVRSKSYAVRTDNSGTKVTAKGVVGAVRNTLPFSAFKDCVSGIRSHEVTQKTIGSKNHINRLLESRKVAFSSFDDKRYQLCNLHSAPYGSTVYTAAAAAAAAEGKEGQAKCFFCLHPDKLY